MATASLIQYLGTTDAVTGAQLGVSPSDRLKVETFITSAAITKGQVVALDVSKMGTDATGGLTSITVLPADFNSAPVQKVVVGVAAESQSVVGGLIKVIVRGPAQSVPVVAATAVGAALILDPAGVAGSADIQTAGSIQDAFGIALTAWAGPGAGTVTAYVYNKGI